MFWDKIVVSFIIIEREGHYIYECRWGFWQQIRGSWFFWWCRRLMTTSWRLGLAAAILCCVIVIVVIVIIMMVQYCYFSCFLTMNVVINHLMEWYDLSWIVVIELVTIGRDGTTRLINLFVIEVGMIIAN